MLASTSQRAVARLAELDLPGQVYLGRTVSEAVRRLPSSVADIDVLLGGGVPRGRLTELLGGVSCGKTSLLLAFLASATQGGEIAAYVDLADALHPRSAAQAGVDLQRLLWVRPPSVIDGMRCTELLLQAGGFAVVALDFAPAGPAASIGSERPACGPKPPALRRPPADVSADGPLPYGSLVRAKSNRLGTSVWVRLQRVAERSHSTLIILGTHFVGGSCAALSLALRLHRCQWQRPSGNLHGTPLFAGLQSAVQVERNKLGQPKAESIKLKVQKLSAFSFQL